MKLIKKIIFLLFLFSVNFTYAFSNEKISFIDVDALMKESISGKKIIKNLNELNKKNISLLKSKEAKIKDLENDINKKKNIISKDETTSKIKILQNEISKFKIEEEKLGKEFNNNKNEKLKTFFNKITPLIEKYINENNITIVFDKKNIFMANQDVNITDDIINLINKNIK